MDLTRFVQTSADCVYWWPDPCPSVIVCSNSVRIESDVAVTTGVTQVAIVADV